jgi:two-component system, cell cycle sensor histidine kinase and response regulator CckA
MNLAINARDAMTEGGTLTIATSVLPHGAGVEATLPSLKTQPCVLLRVADTGAGMSDDVRAHIFEPFFTTKENGRGSGLGLATVYGIVKQSGGEILVSSRVGEGTTFQIGLPLARVSKRHSLEADNLVKTAISIT